ncbi:DEAD/DEAH box helicase [Plantactinospora sp. GCM10030261]|uniref:DEAD/DEAH box helicase n=1 Tax=Plantactinospora sp. GCM10030261 TaxID=3273420 RepID=UPI003618ED6A
MRVVHGVWRPGGRLMLWGEDSTLPATPPRRPGRPPRERPHPYACGHQTLVDQLGDLAAKAVTGSAALTLPTRAGAPVDSPELVRDEPPDTGRAAPTLARWRVPTLDYDADQALAVLAASAAGMAGGPPGAAGAPGSTSGPALASQGGTLRHLAELAGFAEELVRRGRVLPGLIIEPDTARAAWRPVLTGADAAWARHLAAALPPAARAADPDTPLAALVADALDTLTDAAARAALEGVRLVPAGRSGGQDATVHAWLRALTGDQRTVRAGAAPLAALARELDDWQRDAAGSPIRACFRLVEPAEDAPDDLEAPAEDASTEQGAEPAGPDADPAGGAGWRVEFALQPADQPGAQLAADHIWTTGDVPEPFAGTLASPRETLLTELGRASRLWPELTDALRVAAPTAVDLDTEGAHRFLRDAAPVLHAAGFGVLLPGWWREPGARLGARLRAGTPTAPGAVTTRSALGQNSLVDYEWEVALGDQPLTEDELRSLAALKTPLVRLRGQWVELDAKRLKAGLKLIGSRGRMTVTDLLHLALTNRDEPDALPVTAVTAEGPLGDLLSGRLDHHLAPVDPPPEFVGKLRPYQQRGLSWLSFLQSLKLGGILADDMGLGKTIQLLSLVAGDDAATRTGPTLLICPMSLVGNWQREAVKFTPGLRVHVHHGSERARGAAFAAAVRDADVVVTTYSIAARDAAALAAVDWHRIVVDEAQAIKNAATRQAEAVRSLPARYRIAMTGTPVENRLADLWSIMEFANPGLLGPASSFRKSYAEPIERHGDAAAAERLRRITGPFVLRRLKTDASIISDLPEKLEMEVLCNLTAEQASLYQAVLDDMLDRIERSEGIERRGLVLATMTKLKQVCNHPAQLLRDGSALPGRSGKLARLEEIVEEVLAVGEKALLFTQYAEFGGMLRAHLSARTGREVLFLHGGVGKAARDDMVARFQAGMDSADGPPLFVLSLKAGGTGLTLTAANHVVHVDRWWNPAVEDQATDRAFRIGQRRAVQVRTFVCAGTVEEKVATLIADKRGLARQVVGSGEQWLTELSTGQLRELFALDAGAVVE